jgi:peroxiredoxin
VTETLNRPTVGEPAPDITLVDTSGRPWRLESRRGRTVVLIFHRHIN